MQIFLKFLLLSTISGCSLRFFSNLRTSCKYIVNFILSAIIVYWQSISTVLSVYTHICTHSYFNKRIYPLLRNSWCCHETRACDLRSLASRSIIKRCVPVFSCIAGRKRNCNHIIIHTIHCMCVCVALSCFVSVQQRARGFEV